MNGHSAVQFAWSLVALPLYHKPSPRGLLALTAQESYVSRETVFGCHHVVGALLCITSSLISSWDNLARTVVVSVENKSRSTGLPMSDVAPDVEAISIRK